jgi:hypothetical protein
MDKNQRWVLDALKENRDTPGHLYHDNGRHVVYLAKAAGIKVGMIHCDLTTLETTRYTITPEGKRIQGD